MKLYHFTCEHAAEQIRRDMVLKPNTQIQLDGRPLIWFTDLDHPDRAALSLTSVHLTCDRMEYRAVVDADLDRWPDYLRRQTRQYREMARALIHDGAMPMHWYVSPWPVHVDEIEVAS